MVLLKKLIQMKLIAADTGVNVSNTNVAPDILALRTFMEKLYSIAVPNMAYIAKHDDDPLGSLFVRLSQIDETTYKWFSAKLDHNPPQNRSEICYGETSKYYSVAMLAMYARSRSSEALRPLAEGMVRAIIDELTDQIKENEWMEEAFKKAVLRKVSRISWSLLHDDLFINDTALDELYAAHYGLSDRPFLDMLEEITHIQKTQAYLKLIERFDVKSNMKKFSVRGYEVNAFYLRYPNSIVVPLPFLEFPVFHESFPRSFLHGSIGSIIGHEISHSLDVKGRMYDENGNWRTWWKKKWTEEYDKRAYCYVEQYGNIKIPKFNISLNGTLTLGETTADNEGLKIAYRAHQKYLSKVNDSAKTETVDGFTQDQLFFLGLSQ
ncbi:hypothetical protein GCK32_013287, partial [Trichostrongylus colubriformis]